jgi:hypothetical protein
MTVENTSTAARANIQIKKINFMKLFEAYDGPIECVDDEILTFFIEESTDLITTLKKLGDELKTVRIPTIAEAKKLTEFAQKLNRLIGGTATMGFSVFADLSRKTSIIAAKCAEVDNISIRILVINLNMVVDILDKIFTDADSIRAIDQQLPNIKERMILSLDALGMKDPEIEDQSQIDEIINKYEAPRQVYAKAVKDLLDSLGEIKMKAFMFEERNIQNIINRQKQTSDSNQKKKLLDEYFEFIEKSEFQDTRHQINLLDKKLADAEIDSYFK